MSRYPNRIPSRPSRPVQENKPTERASDLFKDVWDTWQRMRNKELILLLVKITLEILV